MSGKPLVAVEIRGAKAFNDFLKSYAGDVNDAVSAAVQATAIECITDIKKSMRDTPKEGGRSYDRNVGKKKRKIITHIASAPGNPPAIDNGILVNSIYYTKIDDLTAAIGSRLEYARYLEFGTQHIAKRPAWIPAVERARPRLQKRIERAIRAASRAAQGKA